MRKRQKSPSALRGTGGRRAQTREGRSWKGRCIKHNTALAWWAVLELQLLVVVVKAVTVVSFECIRRQYLMRCKVNSSRAAMLQST